MQTNKLPGCTFLESSVIPVISTFSNVVFAFRSNTSYKRISYDTTLPNNTMLLLIVMHPAAIYASPDAEATIGRLPLFLLTWCNRQRQHNRSASIYGCVGCNGLALYRCAFAVCGSTDCSIIQAQIGQCRIGICR